MAQLPVDPDFGREADPKWFPLFLTRASLSAARWRIRRFPYRDRGRIEEARDRALRRMVRFAYETVPFYRRALDARGVAPDQIRALEDLRLLPVIGDDEMRADPLQFVSSRHGPDRCYRLFTGGSTGVRKAIYHEPLSLLRNLAYVRRDREALLEMFGLTGREKVRFLSISPSGSNLMRFEAIVRRISFRRKWRAEARAWVSPRWPLSRQVEAINAERPEVISSYALTLLHIYREAHRRGMEIHRPHLFLLHSEGLAPEEREFLEKVVGVPTYSLYSSIEARKIGFECVHRNGYHVHEDICPIRILNDRDEALPAGEPGRVVISNLLNRGSVLLNFDLGDIGCLDESPCPCGRRFARLHLSHARTIPMLSIPGEDRAIHYSEFQAFFRGREGLKQFQLVVEAPDRWTIGLAVADPPAARVWLPEAVERIRRELTGPAIQLDWTLLERGEISEAGKMSPVIFRPARTEPDDG